MENNIVDPTAQPIVKPKSYLKLNIVLLALAIGATVFASYMWMNKPEQTQDNIEESLEGDEVEARSESTRNVADDLSIGFTQTSVSSKVGETSSVTLTIDGDISEIESLEVHLAYDSELITIGEFEKGGRMSDFEEMIVDEDAGEIILKATNPNITVSSNFLGKLNFETKTIGETTIQLLEDDLFNESFATVKYEGDVTVYSLGAAEVGIKVE